MIWWFLILGVSTFVVVCAAIAIYMRVRRHMQEAHPTHEVLDSESGGRPSSES